MLTSAARTGRPELSAAKSLFPKALPKMILPSWLELLLPAETGMNLRQRLIVAGGVFIGIVIPALVCGFAQHAYGLPWWLMAPLGASAVHVFAVPGSPLAQPWQLIAGHALSALAGLIAFHLFGRSTMGAALAVSLAALLMLQLRALHPTGGGTALFVILTGTGDPLFILFPVVTSVLLLVLAATAYHNLTGHSYPQRQRIRQGSETIALHRFDPADLESALREHDQMLDISREDIKRLIADTEMRAYQRMARDLTCEQIMTRQVKQVDIKSRIDVARHILARHELKLLPVIGSNQQLAGAIKAVPETATGDVRAYLTQDFVTAVAGDSVAEVLPLLAAGKTHVLVIDDQRRLKGIISRSDIMRAVFHNQD